MRVSDIRSFASAPILAGCRLIRAHVVHLTLLTVFVSSWIAAWGAAVERESQRLNFPPYRAEEIAELKSRYRPVHGNHHHEAALDIRTSSDQD